MVQENISAEPTTSGINLPVQQGMSLQGLCESDHEKHLRNLKYSYTVHVPQNIRENIWANKYIDLGTLKPENPEEECEGSLGFVIEKSGVRPLKKTHEIAS